MLEILPTIYMVIMQRWGSEYVEAIFRDDKDAKEFKEELEATPQYGASFRIDERKLR